MYIFLLFWPFYSSSGGLQQTDGDIFLYLPEDFMGIYPAGLFSQFTRGFQRDKIHSVLRLTSNYLLFTFLITWTVLILTRLAFTNHPAAQRVPKGIIP